MFKDIFESCTTDSEVKEAQDKVCKLITSKQLKIDKISIRDVAESTLGPAGMRALSEANSDAAFVATSESTSSVNMSAFTNITGTILFEASLASYEAPEFIGKYLVKEESARQDGGTDIGLAPIDEDAIIVSEGEEFHAVKFSEDYISIPTSVKRGLKIGVTREIVFFDQTGKLIEQAQTIGGRIGLSKEKRILQTVLGITNSFTRKGVARNTYVAASGTEPRANRLGSTPLLDWTTLDKMLQLFNDMNDDRTIAEPINVMPDLLLVPKALETSANRIMNVTEVRQVTNTNITSVGGSPIGKMQVLSSPWITKLLVASGITLANSKEYWYAGQFNKAFKYRTLFPYQMRAATHDKDEFDRDVVAQYRADERGVPRIVAPWNVAQFLNA